MLRLLTALWLSLTLAGCSMGYVSLPLTSAGTATLSTPANASLGKTALGGPARPSPRGTALSTASTQRELASPGALDLINELRHAQGLAPLTVSPELTRAAQMQAANLARSGLLAHVGPDGSTPLDRVRMAGYKPRMAAENIAGGQETIVDVVRTWRESETHMRNLMLADAVHMGIARVDDPRSGLRTYWTLVLGAPR